jgi:transcriptional regulator with XRE-family HTH domain
MSDKPLSPFGQQLRRWRQRAGLSQLDLANSAGTSPRHVSFIETGRSRPGRELVLRLAEVLDVPLRERNVMLVSAGLLPAFPSRDLSDAAMSPVSVVLERILISHEPYPAWVARGALQFIASNQAAESLFPGLCALTPEQIVDFWYAPGPFRELVENWQEVLLAGLASLSREATRVPSSQNLSILQRAESHLQKMPEVELHHDLPVVCLKLKVGERTIRTMTTVMRFDAALDVTASELRVEMMFPADPDSEAFFRQGAGL